VPEEMEITVIPSESDSWKYPKPGIKTFSVCPQNTGKADLFLVFMRKTFHILTWPV